MKKQFICPTPNFWFKLEKNLNNFAKINQIPNPPKGIYLSSWHYCNDFEKRDRWNETVAWINKYQCTDLIISIPEKYKYSVLELSDYTQQTQDKIDGWFWACRASEINEVKKYLNNGFDINTEDSDGKNGLYYLLEEVREEGDWEPNNFKVYKFLIEKGVNFTNKHFEIVCVTENKDIVIEAFDKIGSPKSIVNEMFGDIVLYQSYDFLKFFFGSFHPDINYINENGSKIFWLVGHFNESEQINKLQFLLKKGWDPNIKGKDDDNAFTWLDEIFDVDNNDEKIYNTIYKLLSQK